MINAKIAAMLVAAFAVGSFVASPELRAYAVATIGSADIIDESIRSVDIMNGEVKKADIGADAVGGSEIAGVTKLLFGQCTPSESESSVSVGFRALVLVTCSVKGAEYKDSAIVTYNGGSACFDVARALAGPDFVGVFLRNNCEFKESLGPGNIGIIVFDK